MPLGGCNTELWDSLDHPAFFDVQWFIIEIGGGTTVMRGRKDVPVCIPLSSKAAGSRRNRLNSVNWSSPCRRLPELSALARCRFTAIDVTSDLSFQSYPPLRLLSVIGQDTVSRLKGDQDHPSWEGWWSVWGGKEKRFGKSVRYWGWAIKRLMDTGRDT